MDKIYKKTRFLQTVREDNLVAIWHSLFGNPKTVSPETMDFIEKFSIPKTLRSVVGDSINAETINVLNELVDCYFLTLEDFDDRTLLKDKIKQREEKIINGSLIDYLELIMSETCNFACDYCIHFKNLGGSDRMNSHQKFMRLKIAKQAIDWYLAILRQNGKQKATINFGGGEPLLVWDTILQVIKYCDETYGNEFEFSFSINTNASLITQQIAMVLKKYRVNVASSLDGLREGNDKVRLTKSGGGTFSQVIRGFETLALVGHPIDGIAVTVTEKNFYDIDESIIDWAIDHDMTNVRIDIDVIGLVDIPIDLIVRKLIRIRRYAASRKIDVPGFWSRPAENLGLSTLNEPVAFCGGIRGNSVCVNPSGNIYACGYSANKLGNISDGRLFYAPGSFYHSLIRQHLTGMTKMCQGCMIEGQCGGGCMITHEFSLKAENAKIERMCDFYIRMTEEIIRDQLRSAAV
ncbi:MAG TPA: radical SAM protein [bacterium]|nr:radical SAM protein [bacterium]HNS33942.1 radical SAM protein [bacterium]